MHPEHEVERGQLPPLGLLNADWTVWFPPSSQPAPQIIANGLNFLHLILKPENKCRKGPDPSYPPTVPRPEVSWNLELGFFRDNKPLQRVPGYVPLHMLRAMFTQPSAARDVEHVVAALRTPGAHAFYSFASSYFIVFLPLSRLRCENLPFDAVFPNHDTRPPSIAVASGGKQYNFGTECRMEIFEGDAEWIEKVFLTTVVPHDDNVTNPTAVVLIPTTARLGRMPSSFVVPGGIRLSEHVKGAIREY